MKLITVCVLLKIFASLWPVAFCLRERKRKAESKKEEKDTIQWKFRDKTHKCPTQRWTETGGEEKQRENFLLTKQLELQITIYSNEAQCKSGQKTKMVDGKL